MQDVKALIEQLGVALLILTLHLLHAQALKLEILLVSFTQDFFQLHDLRDAALTSNNCSYCVLNRRPFILQILYFFDYYG